MTSDTVCIRLFIGYEPGKFLIYSATTNGAIGSTDIGENAESIYDDSKRFHIDLSCDENRIGGIHQNDANRYQLMDTIPTVKGDCTLLYSELLGCSYQHPDLIPTRLRFGGSQQIDAIVNNFNVVNTRLINQCN